MIERRQQLGFIDPATAMLIGSGAQTGVSLLFSRQGGRQKREATLVVNEAERLMRENLRAFERGERTRYQALAEFDALWSQMAAGCAQAGGDAGQRCVSERAEGGVYDYFARYRSPIEQAADPAPMMAAQTTGAAAFTGGGSSSAGGLSPVFLVGGLALLVFALGGGE